MLYGLRSLTLTRSRKDLASTLVRMNRILRRLRSLARLHIIIDRACSTFLTSTSTDPQLTLNGPSMDPTMDPTIDLSLIHI